MPQRRSGAARRRTRRHHRRGAGRAHLQGRHDSGRGRRPHRRRPPAAEFCRQRLGRASRMTENGQLAADPELDLIGIPERDRDGALIADAVYDAVESTMESLPRKRRARSGRGRRGGAARGARGRSRSAGAKSRCATCTSWRYDGLAGARFTRTIMIGRLNHVAIAVRDIAKAAAGLPRHARRRSFRQGAAARPRRHHRVHHAAEHQDRTAGAARRRLADHQISRQKSRRRHPSRLLRGAPTSARRATR